MITGLRRKENSVRKTILTFVGLGPLCGFLVTALFYLIVIFGAWWQQGMLPQKSEMSMMIIFLLFAVVYAYILGGAAALTSGLIAAFLMTRIGGTPLWIGPVSGLLSILTSLLLIVFWAPELLQREHALVLLGFGLLHLIAATSCWIVVRRSLARHQLAAPAADRRT